jgi:Transposase (partial DDE domain)
VTQDRRDCAWIHWLSKLSEHNAGISTSSLTAPDESCAACARRHLLSLPCTGQYHTLHVKRYSPAVEQQRAAHSLPRRAYGRTSHRKQNWLLNEGNRPRKNLQLNRMNELTLKCLYWDRKNVILISYGDKMRTICQALRPKNSLHK